MPKSKKTAVTTAVPALAPDKLRQICLSDNFPFNTTADLTPETQIIGQPRGTRSIAFGIGIHSHGYRAIFAPTNPQRARSQRLALRP